MSANTSFENFNNFKIFVQSLTKSQILFNHFQIFSAHNFLIINHLILIFNIYPHVEVDVRGLDHAGDGVDHVEAHLHGVAGVITAGLRQPGHAVVAVTQNLDPETLVVLNMRS